MIGISKYYLFFGLIFITRIGFAQESNLFINEILAVNHNGIQDDFLEFDDWLEIYYQSGSSPAVINLAGYFLSDNPNNLTKWKIPDTNGGLTTVITGQHILFWIDKDPEQGENHVDFKFSADGEFIYLTNPDTLVLDSVSFGPQVADISYGRACDGCEEFVFFNNTTPEAPNQEIVPAQEVLFVNEVMANNSSYIDDPYNDYDGWIEIYNPNAFQVNLAGYQLSNTSDPSLFTFAATNPELTVVPANGFLLIWCDNEENEGENHASFILNGTGTITLSGVEGVVDTYDYENVPVDHSWGRQSDGSLTSIDFNIPTPRVTNSLVIIPPANVYINEILATNQQDVTDNFQEHEDWIEIYNPNSFSVDLAGYFFSDNPENPMKYMIPLTQPDSTTIAPGSWMIFWADEDGSQGINHLNFRLSNNGEEVTLYSPDGFSQADHIEFVGEQADISFGRETDGNSNWVHFTETTPNASNNGAQTTTFVEENNSKSLFKVWPNPVNNDFLYFDTKITFCIYNSLGIKVREETTNSYFDASNLQTGIYLLVTKGHGTKRIVVLNY